LAPFHLLLCHNNVVYYTQSYQGGDKMRTEDGEIIYQCLNGQSTAFGFLVDKYKACIFAFAYSELGNFHDAEDITQDVFIKAYQKLNTLKQYDRFLAWLYSITSNLCKNLIRSKRNRPDKEFIEDQSPDFLIEPSIDSYIDDMKIESLNDAINSLPKIYSQALTLHYLGGMNVVEIARFLGTTTDAIKHRLSRGRTQLKEELIAMMSESFSQQKLQAGFTFRIIEAVKQIKIQPVSTIKGLPWGLSLATGIIIAVMSLNPNLTSFDNIGAPVYSPLPVESKVLKVGEIPVDVVKTSNIAILSSNIGKGKGGEAKKPDMQNAFFMAPQAEGGTWSQKADMDIPRMSHGVCAVNGKLYAFGGLDRVNGVIKWITTIEEYKPELNKWIKKSDMPDLASFGYTALNGKIYIIGGYNINNAQLTTNYEYDPSSNTWTEKSDMPTGRSGLGIAVANGKIYAIGGMSNVALLSVVEEYDPLTDKWIKKADKPDNPKMFFSVASANNKIYVFGGRTKDFVDTQTVYEYDPIANAWKLKDSEMPTFRAFMSACELNGKIYVIGGYGNIDAISTVEEYDPILDSWEKKEDTPTKRMLCAATSLDGKIYAVGGCQKIEGDFFESYSSSVEEYTPEGWKAVSPQSKLPTKWGQIKYNK